MKRVVENAAKVPAYALVAPERYPNMIDAMPRDEAYAGEVKRLIAANDRWRPDGPIGFD